MEEHLSSWACGCVSIINLHREINNAHAYIFNIQRRLVTKSNFAKHMTN